MRPGYVGALGERGDDVYSFVVAEPECTVKR